MVEELELVHDKRDGRRLTPPVTPHQAKGGQIVALRNPPLDEYEFPSNVAGTGASAAIVSDPSRAMNSPSDLAPLQAQDTLTILHKLAPGYRQLMPQRPVSSPLSASSRTISTQEPVFLSAGRLGRSTAIAKVIDAPQ